MFRNGQTKRYLYDAPKPRYRCLGDTTLLISHKEKNVCLIIIEIDESYRVESLINCKLK